MRLGMDFDNTIVRYDELFHRVALEGGWIPADLPASKLSVRDRLRRDGRESVWVEMQGYVYGARMGEASIFPGVVEFLQWARSSNLSTCIVSHKTRHPFSGPKYDLHEAARAWVAEHLRDEIGPLLPESMVYFELTKEEKLARIGALSCTVFVDDLPEILDTPAFPAGTAPVLFDPDRHHGDSRLPRLNSWTELRHVLEERWQPSS
jgi:hypothetical protein